MTETKYTRIAVLSDLHVAGENSPKNGSADSYLSASMPENNENPFVSLMDYIKVKGIKADLLLCCGDIADRANATGQKYAWEKLYQVANALSAEHVIATAGNHDVDSRFVDNPFDPKGNLLALNPSFPGIDEDYSNFYWARNFVIRDFGDIRLLNINSCAFHGYGISDKKLAEYENGRISNQTIENIQDLLTKLTPKKWNIAMFHHHPTRNSTPDYDDKSEMIGGDKLIKLLSQVKFGSWVILHGHQHYPDVSAASGGGNSPFVISLGSFSSKRLENEGFQNQFYIVKLLNNSIDEHELPIAGKVEAYSWAQGTGWYNSPHTEKIPFNAGFGSRLSPQFYVKKILEYIKSKKQEFHSWKELLSNIPNLQFALPSDLVQVFELVESEGYEVLFSQKSGCPRQIGGSLSKDELEYE